MMKSLLNLFLLSAVVLLGSTQTWNIYDNLNSQIRTFVDKAIIQANKQFKDLNQHINFYSLEGNAVISTNYYVRAKLRTTVCPVAESEGGYKHRKECGLKGQGRPWIDCVVCRNKNGGELIDCAKHKDLSKREEIRKACSRYFHGGAVTMFLEKTNDKQELGCPGCV